MSNYDEYMSTLKESINDDNKELDEIDKEIERLTKKKCDVLKRSIRNLMFYHEALMDENRALLEKDL